MMVDSDDEWVPAPEKTQKKPPKTCWEQRSAIEFFKPVDKVTGEEKKLNKDGSGARALHLCAFDRMVAGAKKRGRKPKKPGQAAVPRALTHLHVDDLQEKPRSRSQTRAPSPT